MVTLPIFLPTGYILKITKGDTVKPGDTLAEKQPSKEISINIAKALGIPIKKSAKTLKKNAGDKVLKGDILASKKRTFGFGEDAIESEVDGTVMRYERDSGIIIISPEGIEKSDTVDAIFSPIDGTVQVCDNDRIVLSTDKDVTVGESGNGKEFEGVVYNIKESQEDPEGKVQLHFLDSNVIGKIIVGGSFDRDVLLKAIGMGVGGVIAFSIRDEDLTHIASRNLTTPVITVDKDAYMKMLSWNAKKAYIQGAEKTILLLHL